MNMPHFGIDISIADGMKCQCAEVRRAQDVGKSFGRRWEVLCCEKDKKRRGTIK